MSEGHEQQRPSETGDENASDTAREAATGNDETSPAQGTPPVEGGGRPGQTQTPAPEDDVGVPEHLDDRTD
ncbi:MAG: hypothetical protein QOK21_589 [Solirubrobacteraceae bacterium]|jgi:hypothetical protein|nr:hypothetical protein [Solirubrobacteraceae bacterium]